jgi:molecular chaperone DnaK (HSP70)
VQLGIDLGTTRTVVAASDRGNYPVISFATPAGEMVDHLPTISADRDGELVHGHEAVIAARDGHPALRSWKRLLVGHGPDHRVTIGSQSLTLLELTTSFARHLGAALLEDANLPAPCTELPAAVVSVPANAHSAQRFITLEAFRGAGFPVRGMLNEPSAGAIEFAHRYRREINSKRQHVAVYDLGGGTFDAARVRIADGGHQVMATSGIQRLGGDDFDAALLELVLERCAAAHDGLAPRDDHEYQALLDECRDAKEQIVPATKRIVLELDAFGDRAPSEPLVLKVADFYQRLEPLVARTVLALAEVLAPHGEHDDIAPDAVTANGSIPDDAAALQALASDGGVAGVYVVGGASGLPAVPRALRERFGRRLHRSSYPSASTAIGLAIAADDERDATVGERFTRHFGVFREREGGREVVFDPIFPEGTPMPGPDAPPLVATRSYRAAHNVGHFRFVECSQLSDAGEPAGDISPHGALYFPFASTVRDATLERVPIARLGDAGPTIEERYEVDAAGVVAVTIRNLDDGYQRRAVL